MNPSISANSEPIIKKKINKLSITRKECFSGPIPHPEILKRYEDILPGAANRIISMAERQSKHRQKIEEKVIDSNIFNEKKGMFLAFLLTIVFIVGGITLILFNKNTVGYITLGSTFILHVINFLLQKEKKTKKLEKDKK